MELRDIEIFLTLAEELHFGRTAARLHVSQARISQSIKQQERRIGGALFERSSRTVRLTPVGEQLRGDLLPIYHGLKQSVQRARDAARGVTDVLRIGMIPSNTHDLRPFWDTFRKRHPQWGLRVRHNQFMDPFGPLRRGQIDLLVSWLPVEERDLTVGPMIFCEPRVLAVASDHVLAGSDTVSWEVLGDFGSLGAVEPAPDYWEDAFTPFYTPSGRPVERQRTIATLDDLYTLISMGEGVNSLGRHVIRYHPRPDVVYLPYHDAPLLRWGLVWRSEPDSPLIRGFLEVVRDLGTPELS
ncbi:LysR family transcriptional regulator [Kribbella sp. VKM Ac-2568]|uniref:LysR family transcriptional regulator n=1 Tax=Kribbella sp. VKM Ac-2568 TaxID=2512219 RepID=UPI00104F4865|nr:LysR family transcriptional regulator [Kribbella sp. VKM Ac-2568]TCM45033.1 DNA-binding transcriptional LysR family regulator [Kribbella sp. VKM Ac-2568]